MGKEEKINATHFRIPRHVLEERIGMELNGRYHDSGEVSPLRHIQHVDYLEFLTHDFLESLIRHIPLKGEPDTLPYEQAQISLFSRESKGVLLSQRFVMEDKLVSLMNSFSNQELFKRFVTKGISDMPPTKVYGRDHEDKKVFAIYLPPIIEQRNEGEVLLDGTHRSYICKSVGSGVYAVHIAGVNGTYPTTPVSWEECVLCKVKPPKEVRYKDLDIRFFRDLNYIGVDG